MDFVWYIAIYVVISILQAVFSPKKDEQTKTKEAVITAEDVLSYINQLQVVKTAIEKLANVQSLKLLIPSWIELINIQINSLHRIQNNQSISKEMLGNADLFSSMSADELMLEYHRLVGILEKTDELIALQHQKHQIFYFCRHKELMLYLPSNDEFKFLNVFADDFDDQLIVIYENQFSASKKEPIEQNLLQLIHIEINGSISVYDQMILSKQDEKYLSPNEEMIENAPIDELLDLKIRKPYVNEKEIHWDIDQALHYWTDSILQECFQFLIFRDQYLQQLMQFKHNTLSFKFSAKRMDHFPLRLKFEVIAILIDKLKLKASFQDFLKEKSKLAPHLEFHQGSTEISIPISSLHKAIDAWVTRFYKCKFHFFSGLTIENIKWQQIYDAHIKPLFPKQEPILTKQQILKKPEVVVEENIALEQMIEEVVFEHQDVHQNEGQFKYDIEPEKIDPIEIEMSIEQHQWDQVEEKQQRRFDLFDRKTMQEDIVFALSVGDIFKRKSQN